ncbi:MAG TPA: bifunctional diguanylate cyclase/phosphodiesterase [Terracidiphilus sp.]|jgi:diguanylate cyclase (GGDEF)-like protein/PAS domain S-box-containing protein
MDQIITNIASLGLLVFLFTVIARRAADDRLRCWVAGWISILIHIGLKLWIAASPIGKLTNISVSIAALILAAIFFMASTMVVREGRRAGLRLGGALALVILPSLTMAIVHPRPSWLLAILVIVQQGMTIRLALRPRVNRRSVVPVVVPICAASLAWMLYGISRGHGESVVFALLAEMYVLAGADFWFSGWERSLGLKTTCAGLIAFGAIFPSALLIGKVWPRSSAASDLFGISAFAVAIGMILIVLEEDARSARHTTEEYRLTFDTNPHPLWIFDTETLEFLAVNEAACTKHGYTREEFRKLKVPDILEKNIVPEALGQIALPNRAARHVRKDGAEMPMDVTAHNIVFRGRPARFVLGIDVSEREELERQVQHHSRHDVLTGLPNRVLFEEQLKGALARAIETREKLAILCLNLDRFKRINDTYGTQLGDECLRQVADILRAKAGPMDLVARTEGDGFALVLTGLRSGFPAEHVLMELGETFREPVVVSGTKVRLSFSAGLALCPDDGIEIALLWRSAESALSRARLAGGGQVAWSSSESRIAAEEQVELEAFMRTQIEERGFHLAYQPLYGMDGDVEGLEALLRLSHPVHGPISPGRLIPLAEETGLIIPIGDWVIEEVCRQLRAWQGNGVCPVPVAINVSALQLMQSGFAERLIGILSRFDIHPQQVQLEVTESTVMLNEAEVTKQMTMLSEVGIGFSIDDFGTGYSSLNRLDKLPLRVLKIDRTFTDRLCAVNGTRSIVQAIISMAKALDMRIVAEGVEREEQIAVLSEMECDYLQGFLLSRPAEAADIPGLLQRRHALLEKLMNSMTRQ